jgi:nucleoside-diphosphate-sugar epimerase
MNFVTGATGLLGSHIVEQLIHRGERVRALVRPGSDTRFLQSIGVELWLGDLSDAMSLQSGLAGAKVVYHAAAKVGDWGTWGEFQHDTIDGTRCVVEACRAESVQRLVHVSSISAYGHPGPKPGGITEAEPLGTRFWWWDWYTRAKIEAEKLVWQAHEKTHLPVTIIRPGWIYGPRDRTTIFRLAAALKRGSVLLIGNGKNLLNCVYAGNVAEACILAATTPQAIGNAYNVCHDGDITQAEFFQRLAEALDVKPPTRCVPFGPAFSWAFILEAIYRAVNSKRPPYVTRYATWLIGRNTRYSTEKAQRELGWKPRVGYVEGIRKTVEWYRSVTPLAA